MQDRVNVTHEVASVIENTREGVITIDKKEYFIWCGTLYETYSKFGYCDEVEVFIVHEKEIKDYFIRLTLDNISIFYKGVNTLKNIDVSKMSWDVKKLTFEYLISFLVEKSKITTV